MALLADHANGRIRRDRVFRDHNNLLAHDDDWLMSCFRFPRAMLLDLCAELGPALKRAKRRFIKQRLRSGVGMHSFISLNIFGQTQF